MKTKMKSGAARPGPAALAVRLMAAFGGSMFLLACPGTPVTPTPDASDASTLKEAAPFPSTSYVDDDNLGDVCDIACLKLWQLGCPEAGRNDAGTCPTLCRKSGPLLDASCVARATTIPGVQACHVRCLGP
jgi:hypothetical protein